jgi:hypothetical protein
MIPAKISSPRNFEIEYHQSQSPASPGHIRMPKFVPRERKHKVLARAKQSGNNGAKNDAGNADANAAEILPVEKREREDKKRVLKEQLIAEQQGEGKMSGKKKKRLDKYIVHPHPKTTRLLCQVEG